MRFGLVTYNWGKDWDLPTLLKNCAAGRCDGVELRSTHRHGVEPKLNEKQRREVQQQFGDSPVELVGLGSACEYHSPDPAVLKKHIDETKAFVVLCHDIGGGGVKVRPNDLPKDVPAEKTIEQIGKSLNQVAEFAAGYGVEIRVEVHGRGTADIPTFKKIMDVADNKNVRVCWNCNGADLEGKGLEHNFDLLKDRFGQTVHIHDLRGKAYPWEKFFALLKKAKYEGWALVEEGAVPPDIVAALKENRKIWEMLAGER
jgi:sugar phosphate isomerase/epimerase